MHLQPHFRKPPHTVAIVKAEDGVWNMSEFCMKAQQQGASPRVHTGQGQALMGTRTKTFWGFRPRPTPQQPLHRWCILTHVWPRSPARSAVAHCPLACLGGLL
jgi:hypothetical protein